MWSHCAQGGWPCMFDQKLGKADLTARWEPETRRRAWTARLKLATWDKHQEQIVFWDKEDESADVDYDHNQLEGLGPWSFFSSSWSPSTPSTSSSSRSTWGSWSPRARWSPGTSEAQAVPPTKSESWKLGSRVKGNHLLVMFYYLCGCESFLYWPHVLWCFWSLCGFFTCVVVFLVIVWFYTCVVVSVRRAARRPSSPSLPPSWRSNSSTWKAYHQQISYHILPYVISYLIRSNHILSDVTRSYQMSYHILSYQVISHRTRHLVRLQEGEAGLVPTGPESLPALLWLSKYIISVFIFWVSGDGWWLMVEHLVVMLVAAAELFCSFSTRGCHFPSHLNRWSFVSSL